MQPSESLLPWDDPTWHAESIAWVDVNLQRLGMQRTGPGELVQARPWALVLRIPSSAGLVYFKASFANHSYEAGLTKRLYEIKPACIPTMIAAEPQRGWLLMKNGGQRLREALSNSPDLACWEQLLPRFANLQIDLAGHLPELFALGVPDSSPMLLPELLAELLHQDDWLHIGQPGGLSTIEHNHLQTLLPRLLDESAELSSFAIPLSLHHGDFHDGNIFYSKDQAAFFDWGDSSLSHPFFSLRTAFVSIENTFHLPETKWDDSPLFIRLRDTYLEPWKRFETPQRVLAAWRQANRLSPLASVFSWQRALDVLPAVQRTDYDGIVPSLLQELLANYSLS